MNVNVSPGEWFFAQRWVNWMYDPTLRKQLPLVYRGFAYFCALQGKYIKTDQIKQGSSLFRWMVRANHWFSLPTSVPLTLADGTTLYVDLEDPRFFRAVQELLNPEEDMAPLQTLLNPGDTFVDVGANHGCFSIRAAQRLGNSGQIIAIEPQTRLAALVRQSLAANADCPYQVYEIACGAENGEVSFYVPDDTSGSAGLFPAFSATHKFAQLTVPLHRFDDFFDWPSWPGQIFLKLDIEGGEYGFLAGAKDMITSRRPYLLMEINPDTLAAANVDDAMLKTRLQELGYDQYVELNRLNQPLPLANLGMGINRNILLLP